MASQIRRGAVLSYASVAFNAVAGLLYTPWMVATIGSDDYGLYTLAMSVINLFVMDFGLGDAVSRFLSKYYAEGDDGAANEFMGLVLKLYLAISLALFAVLLGIYLNVEAIYSSLTAAQMVVFKRLFVVVALYSVVSFPLASLNGVLTANELFVKLNGCNLAQRVLTVGLIVVALKMGVGVYALVVVNAAVGLLFSALKLVVARRETTLSPRFSGGSSLRVGEVFGFSTWIMVSQVAQRCIFMLMPSVIAIASTTSEVAVFGLASSLEGYVYTVANSLNGMFMPKVTRVLHAEGPGESLHALAVRVGRIQLLITGAIIVVFTAIGRDFVSSWVGPGYGTLYLCTLLLILPELVELPTMIEGTAIVASGRVRQRGIVYVVMALTNLALGLLMSRPLGAVGACLAICVAYLVRTGGMCALYARHLSFNIPKFVRETYSRWLIAALATFVVGISLSACLSGGGWARFALEALVEATVYGICCWLVVLTKGEKHQIVRLLGSFRRP